MISNTYANTILNTLVRNDSTTGSLYLGLCKTEPVAADGAVSDEPTADSYARKSVKGSFGSVTGGIVTNSAEIQMKTAREAWGEGEDKLMYWFLSHSSTGNAIVWGKIKDINGNEGIEVPANTVPTFYEDQLKASIDVPLE